MTTDAVGGVWTYSLELCRMLGLHGIDILLATMGPPPTDLQRQEAKRLPHVKLCESCYRLEWMDDPWSEVEAAGDWLLSLEAAFLPDVVHINGYAHAALPWKSPALSVAHSCVLSWWKAVKDEDAPRKWDEYRRKVTAGLAAARRVVAPSEAMLQAIRQYYGSLPDAVVIPNGRECRLLRPMPKEPLIFSAGRLWDEAKNLQLLEEAAPLVRWPIYIAGSAEHPSGVSAQTYRRAKRLPRLEPEELFQWLSRASIYALPARYEPFGLSVLEAALAGCALVLGDIDSLRENWEGAALFVPAKDRCQLVRILDLLIENQSLREEYGRRALNRARTFSAESMAANYQACYRQLMGQ